jgi:gluconate 5-dehydrogenase
VTDAQAVDTAIAHIESDAGPIDILVNNAGMQHRTPFSRLSHSMPGTT